MDTADLLAALADPAAYPHPVQEVDIRQTHISVVALAGPFAYKLKKSVQLGFLDFSTLEKRRHFCEEEVRLNRRLAPAVYHGVVPLMRGPDGGLRFGGDGPAVEYAVQMVRLPPDATLEQRLRRGEVDAGQLADLARKLAAFHAAAAGGAAVAAFGRFDVVAGNARENFAQAAGQVGKTVSRTVFDRLRDLTEQALTRLRPLIEARAARGVPRDTHGDLHLDHVYLFPDRPPPEDLVVIDCIEFNERFRFADPVADVAFLVMDLQYHGRPDLARACADAYFAAAGDAEGAALLPFYSAYRAVVRAKVEGMKAAEGEVPEADRAVASAGARAHWLLALGELEEPSRRPCLVLVAGLPGSGKSTLARALHERAGFAVLRSDVVRKELAGDAPNGDIYTQDWSDRTYAECRRRAEALLAEGRRVVVDANFRTDRRRTEFLDLAAGLAVPGVLLVCRADPEVARGRLQGRQGDASDADWAVYQQLRAEWQEPGERVREAVREIDANGSAAGTAAQALGVLAEAGC